MSKKRTNAPTKKEGLSQMAATSERMERTIPVSIAKSKFSDYFHQASKGIEIVTKNQSSKEIVSLLSTAMVSAMLDTMKFTLDETVDQDLDNTVTIAVNELPIYGEGKTRDAAIEDLLKTAMEFTEIYLEQIDLYSRIDSPTKQAYMLKLIRCGNDSAALKNTLGV